MFERNENFQIENVQTIIKLINQIIKVGLLTPQEGQICLMCEGLLPDDFPLRIEKLTEEIE